MTQLFLHYYVVSIVIIVSESSCSHDRHFPQIRRNQKQGSYNEFDSLFGIVVLFEGIANIYTEHSRLSPLIRRLYLMKNEAAI